MAAELRMSYLLPAILAPDSEVDNLITVHSILYMSKSVHKIIMIG
jgi:hypothetical protein